MQSLSVLFLSYATRSFQIKHYELAYKAQCSSCLKTGCGGSSKLDVMSKVTLSKTKFQLEPRVQRFVGIITSYFYRLANKTDCQKQKRYRSGAPKSHIFPDMCV